MRFSIPFFVFEDDDGVVIDQEERNEWLKNRIDIFNSITYPSLNQHQNIQVLIFMSEGDEWACENMKSWNDKRFSHIFSNSLDIDNLFMSEVKKIVDPGEKVILMRLDSDDAIHKNFFDGVDDKKFLNKYIVQPKGIKWNGKQSVSTFNTKAQYTTVYTDTYMSPFAFQHDRVLEYPHRVLNKHSPMWLTYVHGGNVSNKFPHDAGQKYREVNLMDFGISPPEIG